MADGGGSNGSRVRLWKVELQKLAEELGFPIQVCHLPPARVPRRGFSWERGRFNGALFRANWRVGYGVV
jgi:hypothetical protein